MEHKKNQLRQRHWVCFSCRATHITSYDAKVGCNHTGQSFERYTVSHVLQKNIQSLKPGLQTDLPFNQHYHGSSLFRLLGSSEKGLHFPWQKMPRVFKKIPTFLHCSHWEGKWRVREQASGGTTPRNQVFILSKQGFCSTAYPDKATPAPSCAHSPQAAFTACLRGWESHVISV